MFLLTRKVNLSDNDFFTLKIMELLIAVNVIQPFCPCLKRFTVMYVILDFTLLEIKFLKEKLKLDSTDPGQ